MKTLHIVQFGNPMLRIPAVSLVAREVTSEKVQQLIANMMHTLIEKKLGVGLAAPQVGKSIALAVIAIRPSELRPKVKSFDLVLINPMITETKGRKVEMWEGCISAGSHGKADLFAKVPRYQGVKVKYFDGQGKQHHKTFTGLPAHVIQHEVDHLNGILFVERVKDTKTYMTYQEYLEAKKQNLL